MVDMTGWHHIVNLMNLETGPAVDNVTLVDNVTMVTDERGSYW